MAKLENDQAGPVIANLLQVFSVFLAAALIIWGGWNVVGDDPFARQAVVWVANVAMLVSIWIGLRARGETWEKLGLSFKSLGKRALLRIVLQSIAVLVFALAAFVVGSMLAVSLRATAEGADMSGYTYLQGNLPMLILALAAVYVVSSFGEEVVYRGFLMTRLAEMGKGTKMAWRTAALISAVVFGLAHFDWGIVGIVQTTFMGLALALSFLLVKRNLWVLVLSHAYVDTVLLVQLYLGPTGTSGQATSLSCGC